MQEEGSSRLDFRLDYLKVSITLPLLDVGITILFKRFCGTSKVPLVQHNIGQSSFLKIPLMTIIDFQGFLSNIDWKLSLLVKAKSERGIQVTTQKCTVNQF